MDKAIRDYLAKIGSKGGKKAKHMLTTKQAKKMVQAREKKRKREKRK
jgi:hypothetical protein